MEDIIQIVKSLEEFGLLIECTSKTIENEASILPASILENALTVRGVRRAGEGTNKVGQNV